MTQVTLPINIKLKPLDTVNYFETKKVTCKNNWTNPLYTNYIHTWGKNKQHVIIEQYDYDPYC